MSVKQDVDELQKINTEIARLYKAIKHLRSVKKQLETKITDYLEREELPAIKDSTKGIVIKLNKETKKVYDTPKKSRIQESISILQLAGVRDAEDVFSKLNNVGKNPVEKKVLRVNKF